MTNLNSKINALIKTSISLNVGNRGINKINNFILLNIKPQDNWNLDNLRVLKSKVEMLTIVVKHLQDDYIYIKLITSIGNLACAIEDAIELLIDNEESNI